MVSHGRRSLLGALPVPASIAVIVLLLFVNGVSGTIFFAHARPDPLVRADAIVVLGGEHDGREAYGLKLAEEGYAHTVLMSDPYGSTDSVMKNSCRSRAGIEVICERPAPSTTRGEALMARTLAETRGWAFHHRHQLALPSSAGTQDLRSVLHLTDAHGGHAGRAPRLPVLGGGLAVHLPVPVRRVGQS